MQIFISPVAALLLSISEHKEQKNQHDSDKKKNFMLFKLDNIPGPRFLATIHRFAEGELTESSIT